MTTLSLPKMFLARQRLPAPVLIDVEGSVITQLKALSMESMVRSGEKVGITVGSRGIANIPLIIRTVADYFRTMGLEPFLIPSMGTHGGARSEGQIKVLESLGISQAACGAEIIPCVDTVLIGKTPAGCPVYVNKAAIEMDHIFVVNRIKPHTDYTGDTESGIVKMMAIGLGSYQGALVAHSFARNHGYAATFQAIAQVMMASLSVIGALGIIENWRGQTAIVKGLAPYQLIEVEKRLLKEAKALTGNLPFHNIDVLLVEELGKDVSGTGLDTKVIGRIMIRGQEEPKTPCIGRIVVLDLTEGTHGNATGIGLADITTERVTAKIDYEATKLNCIGSLCPEQGRIPIAGATDLEALQLAIQSLGAIDPHELRVVHIKNTIALEEFQVSEALRIECAQNPNLEIVSELYDYPFKSDGSIVKIDELFPRGENRNGRCQ